MVQLMPQQTVCTASISLHLPCEGPNFVQHAPPPHTETKGKLAPAPAPTGRPGEPKAPLLPGADLGVSTRPAGKWARVSRRVPAL